MYEKSFEHADLSSKKILVSGGAGFIGSNIVEYFLKQGAKKVRVLDNLSTGHKKNIEEFFKNPSFEFIKGDIRSMDDCIRACQGMDMLSHQAALGSVPRSVKDPVTTHEVNSGGFVNLLFAAKEAGIHRVVYASSSSVYGDNKDTPKTESKTGRVLSPYAASKVSNEIFAGVFSKCYGMNISGLRYFNVFGPRQDPEGPYAAVIPLFIKQALSNKPSTIHGDGKQSRDFTFVENVVQANALALSNVNKSLAGEVFNVACGISYSILNLHKSINTLCGKNLMPIFGPYREGDIKDSLASIHKISDALQYFPTVDFVKGLEITVTYFKELNKY